MYKGSLFEKLMNTNKLHSSSSYEEALCRSIASNLSSLFSTNIGNSESAKDYGKPDLDNEHLNKNDSLKIIEIKTKESILKFEPRLTNPSVLIDEDTLEMNEMKILVEAFIQIEGKLKRINFNADLLKNGGVKVNKYAI